MDQASLELLAAITGGIQRAHGHSINEAPLKDVIDSLSKRVSDFCGFDDGFELNITETGFLLREEAIPGTAPVIGRLWQHLRALRITSMYVSSWSHAAHVWRFLVVMSQPSATTLQQGGLRNCLNRVECTSIRVKEAALPPPPPPPSPAAGTGTAPSAPPPPPRELLEIRDKVKAVESGDTILSTPVERPRNASEEVALYQKITRDIIRAFRPEGAEAAAKALIMSWRRIAVVKAQDHNAGLNVRQTAALMQRLEPLVRFGVLAELKGSNECRLITALIPDYQIAEAIAAGVVWGYPNARSTVQTVMEVARPPGFERHKIREAVTKRMAELTKKDAQTWASISKTLDLGD